MCISCSAARTKLLWFPLYRAQQQCSPASDILINYFNLLLSTTFTVQSRWRISPAICNALYKHLHNIYYSEHYVSARIAAVVSTIVSVVLFCVQTNVWRSLAGPRATALMTSWLQWIGTSHHTSTIMMVYNYLHLHWQAAATDNKAEMSLTAVEYISMSSTQHNSSHVSTWPL